jgi:HD superfamily phosphodiesterase
MPPGNWPLKIVKTGTKVCAFFYLMDRDCSHDLYHIKRVVNLALTLAKLENIDDLELVQLGATLHDVNDQKYRHTVTLRYSNLTF